MLYYNTEQLLRLDAIAADHFRTVVMYQYKRNDTAAVCNEVLSIYESASQTKYTGSRDWSCALCQYKLFEHAAKLYYASVKYHDAMVAEQEQESEQDPAPEQSKKTTARKRTKKR